MDKTTRYFVLWRGLDGNLQESRGLYKHEAERFVRLCSGTRSIKFVSSPIEYEVSYADCAPDA